MSTKVDYQETLQLPQTEFPMRGNLPKKEPSMQKAWEENKLYEKLQRDAKDSPTFILHDGPPYANGHIHIGTALNKILKDIVVRSRTMEGYRVPYVPGWDTHGLPIELRAIKDVGVDREKVGVVAFRKTCASYALKYMDVQRGEFKRLGIWGEWENPYLTLSKDYEGKQIEMFAAMVRQGFIYKDLKPVYWCADCETALAEAEIEYHDHNSPSIYVTFQVQDGQGILDSTAHFVIWTTTPWTIPANLAICVHPQFHYVLVDTDKGRLVVAKELLESFAKEVGVSDLKIQKEFTGSQLENITCVHPLYDRVSLVILGDHVTLEAGTGCVHTAPGHGLEDYMVGQRYHLPVFAPVDAKGRFTEEAGRYAGIPVTKGNKEVTKDLQDKGALLKLDFVDHSYPHCWRCKEPIIFRATEQWFASLNGFRKNMLEQIKEVKWIPSWGVERITNMVADRSDWCISRQRVWGVPIPIFYCSCGEAILEESVILHVAGIFREAGSDAWYAKDPMELLPEGFSCSSCGAKEGFTKETDIMDVWFDSGVSHGAVLEQHPALFWPADLYLEGSDQHRGWFQSSLATSVAVYGKAPYKTVLTHGFVVDGDGRKMSKSVGNVVEPEKVISQYGADILRMWVASSDYRNDIRVSEDILKQLSEVYRRIRNTARFILGNLQGFEPKEDLLPYSELTELDQYLLAKLYHMSAKVRQAYTQYDFHVMYHTVHHFCAVVLGGFYLDVLKDRLYCDKARSKERIASQSTMYVILEEVVRLIAPVLVFTAEEIWKFMPGEREESVHLARFSRLPACYNNEAILRMGDTFQEIRKVVNRALEKARVQKEIGSSNEAKVTVKVDEAHLSLLREWESRLPLLFIVSEVELGLLGEEEADLDLEIPVSVTVTKAGGEKCERCWKYSPSVKTNEEHPCLCARCVEVVEQ